MEKNGPQFVVSSKGAQKRTLVPTKDISGKRITQVSMTVRYKDTQDESQEVPLEEINTKYKKPARVDKGTYEIITTQDSNNDWANPSRMILRAHEEGEKPKQHNSSERQMALRRNFLPTINKSVTGCLKEEDWQTLIQWIRDGGPNGHVIKAEESVVFKGGKRKGQMKVIPELSVRLYAPTGLTRIPCYYNNYGDRDHYYPICNDPDCLSSSGVTFSGNKCYCHLGDRAYAAVELTHTFNEVTSFHSLCLKFDFEEGASQDRRNQRFKATLNCYIHSSGATQWLNYVERLKTQGVKKVEYVTKKEIFDKPEDADKCLAKWETARLFAKLHCGLWKGKTFENLNLSFALAFKNEGEMEAHLRTSFKTSITCHPVTAGKYKLPDELGRLAAPGIYPAEDEMTIYMQGNHDVMYSGKQDNINGGIASDKTGHSVIQRYLKAEELRLTAYALLYCKKDKYQETEEVVNLCNYIGHLFQLKNKFTLDDYLCLNKEIRGEFVYGKWEVVQSFCRNFFGMEIVMTTL